MLLHFRLHGPQEEVAARVCERFKHGLDREFPRVSGIRRREVEEALSSGFLPGFFTFFALFLVFFLRWRLHNIRWRSPRRRRRRRRLIKTTTTTTSNQVTNQQTHKQTKLNQVLQTPKPINKRNNPLPFSLSFSS